MHGPLTLASTNRIYLIRESRVTAMDFIGAYANQWAYLGRQSSGSTNPCFMLSPYCSCISRILVVYFPKQMTS